MKRALCFVVLAACAPRATKLSPAEVRAPLDESPPVSAAEVETRAGFGVLAGAEDEEPVRALTLRFLNALADENIGQMRALLQKASWQPPGPRLSPVDEFTRRFAMLDFQVLRTALAQGTYDSMQVRAAGPAAWDVRLPPLPMSEPVFTGRPVLHVAQTADQLVITGYGEE